MTGNHFDFWKKIALPRGGTGEERRRKKDNRKERRTRTPRRTRNCISECSTLCKPCHLRGPWKNPKVWGPRGQLVFVRERNDTEIIYALSFTLSVPWPPFLETLNHTEHPHFFETLKKVCGATFTEQQIKLWRTYRSKKKLLRTGGHMYSFKLLKGGRDFLVRGHRHT